MQVVGKRLAELAEYFDRKPPSATALLVWGDALSGCGLDDVLGVLSDWPKSKRAFPIASEVVESCRTRISERHESLSRRDAESTRFEAKPSDPNSPAYLRWKAWFAAFKANPPPCPYPDRIGSFVRVGALLTGVLSDAEPNPDAWWHAIIGRWRNGEPLLLIQQVNATNAWVNAGRPEKWTPPDAEAAAERAAIQAESS
jgi:hypothetical protein